MKKSFIYGPIPPEKISNSITHHKHKTNIGEGSFIGTNSSLVAPINIGKNAYVGAGSTITKDIPDDALGVGRGKQINKENWSKKKK